MLLFYGQPWKPIPHFESSSVSTLRHRACATAWARPLHSAFSTANYTQTQNKRRRRRTEEKEDEATNEEKINQT